MLDVVQAGHAGQAGILSDMRRLRKRVAKKRIGTRIGLDVALAQDGPAGDAFDLPNAVYLLAKDTLSTKDMAGRASGAIRLLPTTGPTLIRDMWPGFLDSLPIPSSPFIWEASHLAVDGPIDPLQDGARPAKGLATVDPVTQELFCGLAELCVLCGIREIHALYDMRIERLLRRLDCRPRATSRRLTIAGVQAETGVFATDETMLARLRAATGIREPLIDPASLPPILKRLREHAQAASLWRRAAKSLAPGARRTWLRHEVFLA